MFKSIGDLNMKKIMPIVLVGILVLSGFGAFTLASTGRNIGMIDDIHENINTVSYTHLTLPTN